MNSSYSHKHDNTSLVNEFVSTFDLSPTVVIRAPGRVNLIGEHTDYNGYPVLPVSIPFTITVAASPRTDRIIHMKLSFVTQEQASGPSGLSASLPSNLKIKQRVESLTLEIEISTTHY